MAKQNSLNRLSFLGRWLNSRSQRPMRLGRRSVCSRLHAPLLIAGVLATLTLSVSTLADTLGERHALHYAPNHNFGPDRSYTPARAGFNVADVSHIRDLSALGPGVSVLVWVGLCRGVDEAFLRIVNAYARVPHLFGFYLMDDPDPRPATRVTTATNACPVVNLRAEADWIHAHVPGARTLIVIMNLGDGNHPYFGGSYEPAESHIDLFGLAAYPCRTELKGCDYDIINRYVVAAVAAGIPTDRIVPIYQTFGGGGWKTDTGGQYALPTVQQATDILSRWRQLVPRPEIDMAYSWGVQRGDAALETAADLQTLFAHYNRSPSLERSPNR